MAKSKAAMLEHASPRPAIHVQWEQIIVPHLSAAIQGLSGVADTDCECLTLALSQDN